MKKSDLWAVFRKVFFSFVSSAIVIAAFWYLCKNFSGSWHELKRTVGELDWFLFILASCVYALAFCMMAWLWTSVQYKKEDGIGKLVYMNIFIVTAFARYIPGGIWNIAGKAAWCIKKGASPSRTTGAICVEYLFNVISACCFIIFFIPEIWGNLRFLGIIIVLSMVICLIALPWLTRIGLRVLDSFFKSNSHYELSNKKIFNLLAGYIFMWGIVGVGVGVLSLAIAQNTVINIIPVAFSYPVAWVAGFISPTPNGLGVRELVQQFFIEKNLSSEQIVILLAAMRCWTAVGEVIALLGVKIIVGCKKMIVHFVCKKTQDTVKKTVFVSTKNSDYLRNRQEMTILEEQSGGQVISIVSPHKSYLVRCVYVYCKLFFLNAKDISEIFIGFAPQLVLPFWYWKFKKNKITIDFFISLYDTFVCDRCVFKPHSIFARLLLKLDKLTLKLADEIICDTKAHGQYFIDFLGAEGNKVKVLYLEADRTIYSPDLYPVHQFDGKKLKVLYFGSILPLQGVETIIDTILLLSERNDIEFTVIGPLKKKQRELLERTKVRLFPFLKQCHLAAEIAQTDLCLAGHFNKDIDKAARTIPGKAYIYNAMNKTMVLGDTPANRELFDEKQPFVIFSPRGDSQKLAEVIVSYKERLFEKQKGADV